MKGTATAHAAITVVNALPAGVGCALGISIPVTATVSIDPATASAPGDLELAPAVDTPLVREAVREAFSRVGASPNPAARVEIVSGIPPARGLKSSSAVASAAAGAAARALGRDLPALELARISAAAGRRVGLSATGAFDDALAGLTSGFVLTDNRKDRLLRSTPVDPRWSVALLIPPGQHPPSPERQREFERRAAQSIAAIVDAAAGRWARAMECNSVLVEEVMGYDYSGLRSRLTERGAVACGVSGLGPTLAALVGPQHASAVLEAIPEDLGERRLVPVCPTTAPTVGGVR